MTGLKLINGGGRCEIEAAHIIPVAKNGPDSPRNGIAFPSLEICPKPLVYQN